MHLETLPENPALPIRTPQVFPTHAGKSFLVTGAARGLGRAVAELLLAQGARIALLDILDEELKATVADLGGEAAGVFGVRLDLAGDPESIAASAASAIELLGEVDGLANVAGVGRQAPPLDIPRDAWAQTMGINLIGPHEMSQAVANHLIGRKQGGSIVSVASEAGKIGHVDSIPYGASKAAVINETRMMSEALSKHDINVNCVCPGGMPTAMLKKAAVSYSKIIGGKPEDLYEHMIIHERIGRAIDLPEVARVISFLLSDEAFVIRGQAVNVDAGSTPF
jgi:NAD(P)-dependent dehydrogenase (short-subunit alcohol dehydrogenase family)